eukprot:g546.t1
MLELDTVNKTKYGYREGFPYTTSWGASVQYDSVSQLYIMLVSDYAEQCPNWGHNSAVSVATSADPEGPFEKRFRLFGVMSHEPMLARGNSGEWVVYFTAKTNAATNLPANGTDADDVHGTVCTRASLDAKCTCPTNTPNAGSKDPTWVSWTSTPLDIDSWSTPLKVIDPARDFSDSFCENGQPVTVNPEPAESIDANFNGVIEADGSFVGLWRTWQCSGDLCAENHYNPVGAAVTPGTTDQACFSVPHVVKATDWKDPTTYRFLMDDGSLSALPVAKKDLKWIFLSEYSATQAAKGIEDPMIYKDSNDIYHAVFHDMFESCDAVNCRAPRDNVAHAYSVDGTSWTYTGAALELTDYGSFYMPTVTFTDGTTQGLACERPQLIVRDGAPSHIIIGGIPDALFADLNLGGGALDANANIDAKDWPGGATMIIPLKSTTTPTPTPAPGPSSSSSSSDSTVVYAAVGGSAAAAVLVASIGAYFYCTSRERK